MSSAGTMVTEVLDFDGGRQVDVYIPPDPPQALVFAPDVDGISALAEALEAADALPTLIVGIHRPAEYDDRFKEYSVGFDAERFAAYEQFFVEDLRRWVGSRFGVTLPPERTGVWGAMLGGEFALAMGLRHPDIYGAVFCLSPGGGYRPPEILPSPLPRAYLVGVTEEQWFLEHAVRWADALRAAGADVVMVERPGGFDGTFWQDEFPLMVTWAFGHQRSKPG
jgi:enterochelin esterase-like enzyme